MTIAPQSAATIPHLKQNLTIFAQGRAFNQGKKPLFFEALGFARVDFLEGLGATFKFSITS